LLPDPDSRLFPLINELATDTPWLHPFMTGYAHYGIAVFAALLLAGCWIAGRRADPTVLAAAVWAPLGALAAVAINQPIVTAIAEPRPYAVLPGIMVLAQRSSDPSLPRPIMGCWPSPSLRVCGWSAVDSGPWRRSPRR
jgi:undecaprenyl-diphosphatase